MKSLLDEFQLMKTLGKQHSSIELHGVRFLYQSLDEVFVALLTNRTSNIIQDIKTLNLVVNIITEICQSTKEEVIMGDAFKLMQLFDEVFTLGYINNYSIDDIKTIMASQSENEKLQESISRVKENDAKDNLRRKARAMTQQKNEAARKASLTSPTGISNTGKFLASFGLITSSALRNPQMQYTILQQDAYDKVYSEKIPAEPSYSVPEEVPRKTYERDPSVVPKDIHLAITEKINLVMTRENEIETFNVRGNMSLKISDSSKSKVCLNVKCPTKDQNFTCKTHPYIDTKKFNSKSIIALRDASKSFPPSQSLDIFKWKYTVTDKSFIPLTIDVWTSLDDKDVEPKIMTFTLEYEIKDHIKDLKLLTICIPVSRSAGPEIVQNSGTCEYDASSSKILWKIEGKELEEDLGTLEVRMREQPERMLFPIVISMVGYGKYCDVDVTSITNTEDSTNAEFSMDRLLLTEKYEIT